MFKVDETWKWVVCGQTIRKVTTDMTWDEMGVYDWYRQYYRETIDQ